MPCRAALLAYSPEPDGRVVWLTNGERQNATADRCRWQCHYKEPSPFFGDRAAKWRYEQQSQPMVE
jgi:hypothetical protein